jgi:hypothetical protein
VLCLLLMVFAATAEVRHVHANGNDALRCSVCVVAHSPTLLARTAAMVPEKATQPLVTLSAAPVVLTLAHDSHCIRPPPSPRSL